MREYSLFALAHGLELLVAGLGVASTAQVSKYDCCYPGSPCCFVGLPCCEGASMTANSPTTTAGCCGQAADAPGTGTCCGTAGCCAR